MAKCKTVLARVQVTLEVDVGSWGDNCTMKQIEEQGKEEALSKVGKMLEERTKGGNAGIRIVGQPTMSQIYATER